MESLFIGADPGANGAWAAIDGKSNIISYIVNPHVGTKTGPVDIEAICNWIDSLRTDLYMKIVMSVEDVHALYQVSVSSTSKLMNNAGQISGIMNTYAHFYNHIAFQMISPKKWQKEVWMFHDKVMKANKVDTKATSLACAKRLWPGNEFLATPRCKTPHDGIVDALLIAEASRRLFNIN